MNAGAGHAAMPPVGSWLLVQSKPRAEAVAQLQLANQGFVCFAPRLRRCTPGPEGMRERIEPMFPRYLFVQATARQSDWSVVRSTRGVSALVRFGARLAEVPATTVQRLLDWRVPGCADLLVPPPARFRSGQRVRVTDGPLAGLSGVFAASCGEQRVRVLLDLLGKQAAVDLHPAVLRAS